ncbi:RNA polymerase, sigma-24 subunit, ECF subfamily [Xanthobacter versatilis]|uniref:RNA polymerase sigma factor n=1 Tax=Xanthobacter autotrophicus (strain ATCC BAA-1158 / Py2) TaxID=78245 RepID=A7IFT2_XANP2|nr:RNA polymerase, sigma-24 subunit, ECF subfamily [Xanthobacter autotrophicus Py2]
MDVAEPSLFALPLPPSHRAGTPVGVRPRGRFAVPPAGSPAMSAVQPERRAGADMSALVVAIARTGDREAFAQLFRHFAPRVKAFLMRSGLSANAAEELAQETLLMVWRKASYFDPARAAASTWIFAIARNLSIDLKRRERHISTVDADAADEEADETSGETILMGAERDARVRAALAKLSEEQATIVRLSFFQEKPHSQIAQELGIPLGTAKSRVRLALSRLRTLLEDLK